MERTTYIYCCLRTNDFSIIICFVFGYYKGPFLFSLANGIANIMKKVYIKYTEYTGTCTVLYVHM